MSYAKINSTLIDALGYNLGLRLLSEKPSGSSDAPYGLLCVCKKLGMSLEMYLRKEKKVERL